MVKFEWKYKLHNQYANRVIYIPHFLVEEIDVNIYSEKAMKVAWIAGKN